MSEKANDERAGKTLLVKLSGEALAGNKDDTKFDDGVIDNIIDQMIRLLDMGNKISVVVGGGNFWRGRDKPKGMDQVKADQIGMMATVMNALYLSESFQKRGVEAVIMTPVIVGVVTEQFNKKAALHYMSQGTVVIFACGTGHPFFSTDTIAAIRGGELECDKILFAKTVDGIYDSDPKKNGKARKLDCITYNEVICNNLSIIDTAAAAVLRDRKLLSIFFNLDEPEGIITAATGSDQEIYKIGTKVSIG